MSCSTLTLNCFDWEHFVLFLGGSVLVPYGLYRITAHSLGWTRKRHKTPTQHFETIGRCFVMMSVLYWLGNQSETFDRTTFLSTCISILCYGYLSELSFARTTIPEIRKWHPNMWRLSAMGVIVVTFILWYHVQLSREIPGMTSRYLTALLLPIIWLVMGLHVNGHQNETTRCKAVFHLHHYAIFYVLAFFARFPDTLSRIAAGAFIGASLHGIAAYDYDTTFEHLESCAV